MDKGSKGWNLLIRQAKQGSSSAFSALYEEIHIDLYRFALYMMEQPQDAEDAVSEAVIIAFEKIKTLKKPEAFKSWMFQILANCCRKKLKKRGEAEEIQETISKETAGQELAADPKQIVSLQEAFFRLTNEERMIIALAVLGGYKSNEIGEHLGIPAATVRSKQRRGLRKMKAFLGEEDEA